MKGCVNFHQQEKRKKMGGVKLFYLDSSPPRPLIKTLGFCIIQRALNFIDLRQVGGFLRVLRFPLTIKLTGTI